MAQPTRIILPPALAMLLKMLAQREAERRIKIACKPFKTNANCHTDPSSDQSH